MADGKLILAVTLVGTPEQLALKVIADAIANPPSPARVKAAEKIHDRMDCDPAFERRVLRRLGHTRIDPRTVLRLVGTQTTSTSCATPIDVRRAPRGRRGGRARSRSPSREDPEPSPPDLAPSRLRLLVGPWRCWWDAHVWPSLVWRRLRHEADAAGRRAA